MFTDSDTEAYTRRAVLNGVLDKIAAAPDDTFAIRMFGSICGDMQGEESALVVAHVLPRLRASRQQPADSRASSHSTPASTHQHELYASLSPLLVLKRMPVNAWNTLVQHLSSMEDGSAEQPQTRPNQLMVEATVLLAQLSSMGFVIHSENTPHDGEDMQGEADQSGRDSARQFGELLTLVEEVMYHHSAREVSACSCAAFTGKVSMTTTHMLVATHWQVKRVAAEVLAAFPIQHTMPRLRSSWERFGSRELQPDMKVCTFASIFQVITYCELYETVCPCRDGCTHCATLSPFTWTK